VFVYSAGVVTGVNNIPWKRFGIDKLSESIPGRVSGAPVSVNSTEYGTDTVFLDGF
jgi:hypothetical protein